MFDVIVIGAGPAGMMAAGRSAESGNKTLLLEKTDSSGKKLLLSGNSRCNITSSCENVEDFLANFSDSGKFLRNAFSVFFNKELLRFFRKRGLDFKVEPGGKVFPITDKAGDVLRILVKYVKDSGCRILYRKEVSGIAKSGDIFEITAKDNSAYSAKKIILATGGLSYPMTGSTGFGFHIAKTLGHAVIKPKPGLTGIILKNNFLKEWQGVSFEDAKVGVYAGDKLIHAASGEMIFTHFGISGPVILHMSHIVYDALDSGKKVFLSVDFSPGLNHHELGLALREELKNNPSRKISNTLKEFIPSRLVKRFLESIPINPDKLLAHLSKEELKSVLEKLKGFRLAVEAVKPIEEAMVTCGGVSVKEIDPKTMESKIVKGLYFAGEVIDIDGRTGGYNLQAAFSTGWMAGGAQKD
ncbi:MAG: aminoacetone oxidase family FAD-binding enzyme [Candidatus Omnitrophica bacterium CG22_combo_CG10-13_8_21_14_all_43_16]|nr:MAG: aminoacetone oxidase family FAD-binding enzyme [Candidatus Omnitrophica bacterium CG22_combo_CG10-13_8_21_14_all_43_16]